LVVDDDWKIAQAVAIRARAMGCEVFTAHDGEAGLKEALANRPDAIILDLQMPKRDGLSVLSALRAREDTKHIPVIVLSASTADTSVALEAGALRFLSKPYDPRILTATIDSALRVARAHAQAAAGV